MTKYMYTLCFQKRMRASAAYIVILLAMVARSTAQFDPPARLGVNEDGDIIITPPAGRQVCGIYSSIGYFPCSSTQKVLCPKCSGISVPYPLYLFVQRRSPLDTSDVVHCTSLAHFLFTHFLLSMLQLGRLGGAGHMYRSSLMA
jgi:hypothetical protein